MPGPPGSGRARPFELCEGVRVMFTQRGGGLSSGPFGTLNLSDYVGDDPAAVAGNRERVLLAIGPGPARLAWMRQVHGTDVVYFANKSALAGRSQEPPEPCPSADASSTDSAAIALGALGADCAPILVADPVAGMVGAAHAGRPGMAAGVAPALIEAMTRAGAAAERMHAIIGPSICGGGAEGPPPRRAPAAAPAPQRAA